MKKWLKRALACVAILLVGAVLLLAVGYRMLRGTPGWYHPAMSPEQRSAAERSAEDKLTEARNWVVDVYARQVVAQRTRREGADAGVDTDIAPLTVSLTQDELNAFFQKWAGEYAWRDVYSRYVADPVIVLQEGKLILAGDVKEVGTLVSLHFEPKTDEQGVPRVELAQVLGGNLPLPEALWAGQKAKLEEAVRRNLPRWQERARMDAAGVGNPSAMASAAARLLLGMLGGQQVEPRFFLPLGDSPRGVPVRLTDMRIEEGVLTLTVRPLEAGEYDAFMEQIRQSQGSVAERK